MVRRDRNADRRHGARHAGGARAAATAVRRRVSVDFPLAGRPRRRPPCDGVRGADRADVADGRDAPARRQGVHVQEQLARQPAGIALCQQCGRRDRGHRCGRSLPDSAARNPQHVSHRRSVEPVRGALCDRAVSALRRHGRCDGSRRPAETGRDAGLITTDHSRRVHDFRRGLAGARGRLVQGTDAVSPAHGLRFFRDARDDSRRNLRRELPCHPPAQSAPAMDRGARGARARHRYCDRPVVSPSRLSAGAVRRVDADRRALDARVPRLSDHGRAARDLSRRPAHGHRVSDRPAHLGRRQPS